MPHQAAKCDSPNCPFQGEDVDRRSWHINKGIDLGHILLTISTLAGLIVWIIYQDRRLTTVENGLKTEHEVNQAQDAARDRQRDEWRADIKDIKDKLDRLVGYRR